jgi:hypothetical protein
MTEKLGPDDFRKQLHSWNEIAKQNADNFYAIVNSDPEAAVTRIKEFILKARDTAGPNSHFWEGFVGGPNPDWMAPTLNAIGLIYPDLKTEVRKVAFKSVMGFLDGLKYGYSQNQVEVIDEPWLVADIVINRPLYWSGYADYIKILEKYRTWKDLYPHLSGAKSNFWLAYTVAKPEYASEDIRNNYFKIFPSLVDRTQDAIAAMAVVINQTFFISQGESFEEAVSNDLSQVDVRLVDGIKRKMQEKKWIDLDEPVYIRKAKDGNYYKRRSEVFSS